VLKRYLGLIVGDTPGDEGTVDLALSKISSAAEGWRMIPARKGKPALTHWRRLAAHGGLTLVEFRPETGRTHQIRVHLSEAGHPVIGDARYGGGAARARGFHGPQEARARRVAAAAPRQALHARALAFDPPGGGARVEVVSPLPADLVRLRDVLAGES